ncbi:hypothetical protein D3C86_1693620 [compost metagenome]
MRGIGFDEPDNTGGGLCIADIGKRARFTGRWHFNRSVCVGKRLVLRFNRDPCLQLRTRRDAEFNAVTILRDIPAQ